MFISNIHKSRCTTAINDNSDKFATGVNETSGKFAADVNYTSFKFALVSITPAENFATGVKDTCSAQTVTRIGLLEEIPRSGVQIPCLT